MVGWHHQLNGYEFAQTLGDGDRHGGLACCSPWGCKELDMTERLNNKKWPSQDQESQVNNVAGLNHVCVCN